MQGSDCEDKGSVVVVHGRSLIAEVTPRFAVLQRSLINAYTKSQQYGSSYALISAYAAAIHSNTI